MFISRRRMTPIVGKSKTGEERVLRLTKIMSKHVETVRATKVIAGAGAGDFHVYASFESMSKAASVSSSLPMDAEMQALMAEREADQSLELVGPEAFRRVFGEPDPNTHAGLVRVYQMPRKNLPSAVDLIDEMASTYSDDPINIMATVPIIAENMDRLSVFYGFADLAGLGEGIDRIGMSEEFQKFVMRGNELGTLIESYAMQRLH